MFSRRRVGESVANLHPAWKRHAPVKNPAGSTFTFSLVDVDLTHVEDATWEVVVKVDEPREILDRETGLPKTVIYLRDVFVGHRRWGPEAAWLRDHPEDTFQMSFPSEEFGRLHSKPFSVHVFIWTFLGFIDKAPLLFQETPKTPRAKPLPSTLNLADTRPSPQDRMSKRAQQMRDSLKL